MSFVRVERDHIVAVATGRVPHDETLAYLCDVACGAADDADALQALRGVRSELLPFLRDCLEAGETAPLVEKPRDEFSIMPESVICSGLDSDCVRIYAYIDLVNGQSGRRAKAAGYQVVGDAIGMQARTVSVHVDHLRACGLVEVTEDGMKRVALRVRHNPGRLEGDPKRVRRARGVRIPPVVPTARPKRAKPKIADRSPDATPAASHAPQAANSSGSPQLFADPSTVEESARGTHDTTRGARALDMHEARQGRPVASASEVTLKDNPVPRVLGKPEKRSHPEPAAEKAWPVEETHDRLLAAFPGSAVVQVVERPRPAITKPHRTSPGTGR